MKIELHQPVVVGVPLDASTREVVDAAVALATRLETSLVPVHTLSPWLFPNVPRDAAEGEAARRAVADALAPAMHEGGPPITETIVVESSAARELLEVADRVHAQMLVVGGGQGATIGGWLLGTVADRVVRSARCPVFVVRGSLPGPDRPILCPIDLTPHSHLGFEAALRLARRFEAPLHVLTVLPRASQRASMAALDAEAARLERAAREEVAALVRAHDVRDVALRVDTVAGDAAAEIVDASRAAHLVVLASRAFDLVVPASVGDVASRVLRNARCSVLTVRDLDSNATERDAQLRRIVALRNEARAALENGELARAERVLGIAHALLPGHAAIADDLATVLDRAGRAEEADRYRTVARILRDAHQ
jgi:nucleotide-binding universal stress UspA family protein